MGCENKKNDTFCILPWIHFANHIDGHFRLCCRSKKTKECDYSFSKNSIEEYWSSSYLNRVRQKMLDGQNIPECQKCYDEENIGKKSKRLIENEKWSSFKKKLSSVEDRFEKPFYFDLRMGNQCNLACRSCHSSSSSKLNHEKNQLKEKGLLPKIFDDTYEPSIKSYANSSEVWDDLSKNLKFPQEIYLTGGEPTLVKGNLRILDKLIADRQTDKCRIRMNINMTHFPELFRQKLLHFKEVHISCSIDGYGEMNSYLRPPSSWSTIEKNMLSIMSMPNLRFLTVSTCIQAVNVFDLDRLIAWVENLNSEYSDYSYGKIQIYFNILRDPSFLSVQMPSARYKNICVQKLKAIMPNRSKNSYLVKNIESLVSWIEKVVPEQEQSERQKQFLEHTRMWDRHHGMYLHDISPVLAEDLGYGDRSSEVRV